MLVPPAQFWTKEVPEYFWRAESDRRGGALWTGDLALFFLRLQILAHNEYILIDTLCMADLLCVNSCVRIWYVVMIVEYTNRRVIP